MAGREKVRTESGSGESRGFDRAGVGMPVDGPDPVVRLLHLAPEFHIRTLMVCIRTTISKNKLQFFM